MMFQAKAAMSAHSTVVIVTTFVSTRPLPMVDATAPPNRCPGKIKHGRHRDRLTRRQHFGRDHGRDGVGRVVKTVAVFENDRCENDGKKSQHAAA